LTGEIEDVRENPDVKKDDYVPLGMLDDWKARQDGEQTQLCLSTDAGRYLFTLRPTRGKLYVARMKDVNHVDFGETCSDVLAAQP
jgi:hypothetical protein